MGNSKNMNWSHKCRGKYVKWVVPKTKNSNKHSLNSSRIINLEKLKEYLQVVSQHAATCQACADNALSGDDAIILSSFHHFMPSPTAWQKSVNTEPSNIFKLAAAEAIKRTTTDCKRKATAAAKLQRKKARSATRVDNSLSSRMAYSR